jgi:hypothetical protein
MESFGMVRLRLEKALLTWLYPLVRRLSIRTARFAVANTAAAFHDPALEWAGEMLGAPFTMADVRPAHATPQTIERIIQSYRGQASRTFNGDDSMWTEFFGGRHQKSHDLIMTGSADAVSALLSDPAASDLHYGFDEIFRDCIERLKNLPDYRAAYAAACNSGLVRLGESIGLIRRFSPEGAHLNALPKFSLRDIFEGLDAWLGYRVTLPNIYPFEPGIQTPRGVLTHRSISAIYLACRIRSILRDPEGKKIVEIGGGLGRAAFFCFGLSPARYDIVDIPFTALSQGHFLSHTLGTENVVLQGETPRPDVASPTINLLSPGEFLGSDEKYDLAVSFDSLTEVGEKLGRTYWDEIRKRCGSFLSVNHEINKLTVHSLVNSSRKDSVVLRHPDWLRNGYVEELVLFLNGESAA